jgi:molybdopterin-guanine dinucleotide biosynthesis protein MobB
MMKVDQRQRIDILRQLPILGVCGWSGSGKTTLIEAVMPGLLERNLKVAVVKHDVHAIDIDRPGKDSDRFFQAGADVFLQGNEELSRLHRDPAADLVGQLIDLARRYDLILVEGHKQSPLPKVWLLHEGESGPPAGIADIRLVLGRGPDRFGKFLSFLTGWIAVQWLKTPVYGCICAATGGRLRGTELQLSTDEIKRLKAIRNQLVEYTENIVVVGNDGMAAGCDDCLQLPRSPGVSGPLAAVLTALRWQPLVSWLAVDSGSVCDDDVWQWFLAQRLPGVWGILPPSGHAHGLSSYPAYFDFRAAGLLDSLSENKDFPANIAAQPKIYTPNRSGHLSRS